MWSWRRHRGLTSQPLLTTLWAAPLLDRGRRDGTATCVLQQVPLVGDTGKLGGEERSDKDSGTPHTVAIGLWSEVFIYLRVGWAMILTVWKGKNNQKPTRHFGHRCVSLILKAMAEAGRGVPIWARAAFLQVAQHHPSMGMGRTCGHVPVWLCPVCHLQPALSAKFLQRLCFGRH